MKALLAFAAGWIAFYLADQALYDGHYVRLIAGFVGSIASGFAFRQPRALVFLLGRRFIFGN